MRTPMEHNEPVDILAVAATAAHRAEQGFLGCLHMNSSEAAAVHVERARLWLRATAADLGAAHRVAAAIAEAQNFDTLAAQ